VACGDASAPIAARTIVLGDATQPSGDELERRLPVDPLPLRALLDHRRSQPLVAVERLIGEAVLVGEPALVERFVVVGQHALDHVVLGLHDQVRAQRIVRAHRAPARQLPGAGGEAEGLGGEGADRAEVDDVAREFGIDRLLDEGHDLGVLAAEGQAELHLTRDFLGETHAAGAVDAARHVGRHQRAEVLVHHDALLFRVARAARAVAHRQVLQLAFAALVADRAVERVVDEQELHHPLLRLHGQLGVRPHLHAVGDRRRAGRQRLGRLLDLHQAHAAVGRDGQLLVVAEVRDVGAGNRGSIHHRAAVGNLDLLAVDFDL